MPILAWRRLRAMVGDLSSLVPSSKLNGLVVRLESSNTKEVLAAEAELAVVWAASRVSSVDYEPAGLVEGHCPDLLVNNLFPDRSAVIEVRALSDDSFSGREAMERTANIVSSFIDKTADKAGRNLTYEFGDAHGYPNGRFLRLRRVDPNFQLAEQTRLALRGWISLPPTGRLPFVLEQGLTYAVVTWHDRPVHPESRVHSRMPPVAYDLENNPVYKALRSKRKQVRVSDSSIARCVVLFDVGCDLLRRQKPILGGREIPGSEIILHFLHKSKSVDFVFALTPKRSAYNLLDRSSPLNWSMNVYVRSNSHPESYFDKVRQMVQSLPAPAVEGYQARSLARQGAFEPGDRLSRAATEWESGSGAMKVRISKKTLFAYLSGDIDHDRFITDVFGAQQKNLFKLAKDRMETIQALQIKRGGLDTDDDQIEFELDSDWDRLKIRPQK